MEKRLKGLGSRKQNCEILLEKKKKKKLTNRKEKRRAQTQSSTKQEKRKRGSLRRREMTCIGSRNHKGEGERDIHHAGWVEAHTETFLRKREKTSKEKGKEKQFL